MEVDAGEGLRRSFLYVPGDRASKLAKATGRGADVVIADLEDAVTPAAKHDAREQVRRWLIGLEETGPEIWVRINVGNHGMEDVVALIGPRLGGFVVPKAHDLAAIDELSGEIGRLEARAGREHGSVRLALLIESAAGVLASAALARLERVRRLHLGEADLCAETGIAPGPGELELLSIRAQLVLASAAAGIEPPVGPVARSIDDPEGLRISSESLRRLGFGGRSVIHPAHVPIVNAVFSPTIEELERARALLDRFERASVAGEGVFVDDDGRMIDEAVVRRARRTLRQKI